MWAIPELLRVASSNLTFSDPAILRGTRSANVLGFGARILSDQPCTAQGYELSEKVDHIDIFISHNWATPRYQKFLLLALHFNFEVAIIAEVFVAGTLTVATVYGLLPLVSIVEQGVTKNVGLCCGPVASAAFVLTLFFRYDLCRCVGCSGPLLFLDKACVHQIDADLKRKGIEHLAAFLYYSWNMIILYSEIYLCKLWTVYEVATFFMLHPNCKLEVIPLFVGRFVAVATSTWISQSIFWIVLHLPAVQQALPSTLGTALDAAFNLTISVPVIMVLARVVHWLLCEQRLIHTRLQKFKFEEAECFDEGDRKVVIKNIIAFMHHYDLVDENTEPSQALQIFEELVQVDIPRLFAASLGRVGLPYRYLVGCTMPVLLFGLDRVGADIYHGRPARQCLLMIGANALVVFCIVPLVLAFITAAMERAQTLSGHVARAAAALLTLACAGLAVAIHVGLQCLLDRAEGSYLWLGVGAGIAGLLVLLTCAVYRWSPPQTTRRRYRHPDCAARDNSDYGVTIRSVDGSPTTPATGIRMKRTPTRNFLQEFTSRARERFATGSRSLSAFSFAPSRAYPPG